MGYATVGTRPPRLVKVRGKEKICGVCHYFIQVGEQAWLYSWVSHTGFRKEWHCLDCTGKWKGAMR